MHLHRDPDTYSVPQKRKTNGVKRIFHSKMKRHPNVVSNPYNYFFKWNSKAASLHATSLHTIKVQAPKKCYISTRTIVFRAKCNLLTALKPFTKAFRFHVARGSFWPIEDSILICSSNKGIKTFQKTWNYSAQVVCTAKYCFKYSLLVFCFCHDWKKKIMVNVSNNYDFSSQF